MLIALLKEMIAEAEGQLAALNVERWQTASSAAGGDGRADGFEARLRAAAPQSRVSQIGGWQLDAQSKSVTLPTGKQVRLTRGEFELLLIFLTHAGHVLSREELMLLSQNRSAVPGERTIDVLVNRLRRKLETDPPHPDHIKTIRNEGYVLELE